MSNFRQEVESALMSTSHKGRVLFGVAICQRLFPNYVAFQNEQGWGDLRVLQEGIDLIRQYLLKDGLFDDAEIGDLIDQLDVVTPDTEQFSGVLTSFALDAANSVYCTLNFLRDKNINNILDVSSFAIDTVDLFLQEVLRLRSNDPKRQEKIETSEFMQTEKNKQIILLEKLILMDSVYFSDQVVRELIDTGPSIDLRLLTR